MYIIPYGKTIIEFNLPNDQNADLIFPNKISPQVNIESNIQNALLHPVDEINGCCFQNGKKVGIAINDPTRPVPHSILIPPLLDFLKKNGVGEEDIYFFIANGTHKPINKDEYGLLLSQSIIDRYKIYSHDCDDSDNLCYLGKTDRNTPVYVNKKYFELDTKIVVGNIEPHHFAGFSGGSKSASIGLASRDTINKNHAFLLDPLSFIGNYATNPLRQDIEEIGDMIGITAALNVIMNSDKEIINVLWGTPRGVLSAGIPFSRQVCQKKIDKKYDVVIASPGGYPKDINFYQAQKAITHVNLIAKEKGTIILVAECREGLGSKLFEEYIGNYSSFHEVIDQFSKTEFKVGPHKAYQLALQGIRNQIILVSGMDDHAVDLTLLKSARSVSEAIDLAGINTKQNLSIAIVPYATSTVLY
jgi:nickel-dependent lactate racemase